MYKKSIDTTLALTVIALVIFWMIMISSVSVYPSFKVTSKMVADGLATEPYNSFYLSKNIIHVCIGIFMLTLFSKLSYTVLEKYSKAILIWVFSMLIVVLFVWVEYNGARWWLNIPWFPSLQPVEFAKIGIIIFLAFFMKKKKSLLADFQDGFIPYFFIVGILFLLLAIQPDFWSILIITPVVIALYFVGGWNIRYLFLLLTICLVGVASIYGIGKIGSWWENKSKLNYISTRIDNFFLKNETLFAKTNIDGKDYQMKQWLIALGSGGFFWLGFGKSIQKFWYLPEVQWDFVFSVIVEELWFMGTFILLFVYLTIVYRGYLIARSVKDVFGKYLAFGLSTLILIQVFINIGVNLNVIPLTGVTLPFVSYGGSSLISLMIAVGILLNISRYIEYRSPSAWYEFMKKRRVV